MTCARDGEKHLLHERYTKALTGCAKQMGISCFAPVILPLTEDTDMIRSYAECFDGFLFTGGVDINPKVYGEETLPECGTIDDLRDAFEMALLREVIRTEKPAFGICRGIQTMNVALGGTLWQDIGSQCLKDKPPHCQKDEDGKTFHKVQVSGWIRELSGQDTVMTNSYHHQAIRKPGEGLRVIAYSEDGIAEAMVHESLPFYRAVQWHPEMQPEKTLSMKLFEAFLSAVKNQMNQ